MASPAAGRGAIGGGWSSPEAIQRGIGRALLTAVVTWAGGAGHRELLLWAPEGGRRGTGARPLYRGAGVRETGRIDRLRPGSAREIIEMRPVLPAAG